jgi:hypothetical protein
MLGDWSTISTVLGQTVVATLFGDTNAVGQRVRIGSGLQSGWRARHEGQRWGARLGSQSVGRLAATEGQHRFVPVPTVRAVFEVQRQ